MTNASEGELQCPQCGHSNPAKADYCWECRYDFVHDERLKDRPRPPRVEPAPKPIPPPYTVNQPDPHARPKGERVTFTQFAFEALAASIIVGGSWALLSMVIPNMSVGYFALGWVGAMLMVILSEGVLPDPETDVSKYYALNPFEYRDDMNRKVLSAHISLFLPRVVLRAIRSGFSLIFAR